MTEAKSESAIHGAKKGRHALNKLSARFVQTAKCPPKWHSDGGGLYLRVTTEGRKSWVFVYPVPGAKNPREMGLGSYPAVSLEEARQRAADARRELRDGIDPIDKRKAKREQGALERGRAMTFAQCAEKFIESHRAGWKNAKHVDQWTNTLRDYCGPVFGDLPVAAVDTALVLKVLQGDNLWTTKPETASRLRGRIESVLAWATTAGYRPEGQNPAAWRGHLENLLPPPSKVKKVQHHPALPYLDLGKFMVALRKLEGITPRALEFAILTAARSGEARGMAWSEIDFKAKVWTIPGARMKAGKEHVVPLAPTSLKLLTAMKEFAGGDPAPDALVFPGAKEGHPLSDMALTAVLRRMKRDDLTVHGFRSTFRDWAGETTGFPREVIEHALAHQLRDKAEAAYARGTLLDKRRKLMESWDSYSHRVEMKTDAANVVLISAA